MGQLKAAPNFKYANMLHLFCLVFIFIQIEKYLRKPEFESSEKKNAQKTNLNVMKRLKIKKFI
ncbi:hypothetical protein DERP_002276 [Dermatophagoides pteronyssinus]|uniref:Uncharacterized protein n=1 Tax=Dermatophagoides pteronyssinus TaxID=6956 RepID=A0ABQ8JH97_DERPT|nr:hypothetical protein DERP_002276 [Dermatophagoides pteronyssinus]